MSSQKFIESIMPTHEGERSKGRVNAWSEQTQYFIGVRDIEKCAVQKDIGKKAYLKTQVPIIDPKLKNKSFVQALIWSKAKICNIPINQLPRPLH